MNLEGEGPGYNKMRFQTFKGCSARSDNFLLLSANPLFPEQGNCTEQLFSSRFCEVLFGAVHKTRYSRCNVQISLGHLRHLGCSEHPRRFVHFGHVSHLTLLVGLNSK